MANHALFDSALTIHAGPGAEFNADTDAAPAGLVFQIVGVIVLIIALATRSLRRDNPGREIERLTTTGAPQTA